MERPESRERRFGRYRLGPQLGSGGMATVSFAVATGAHGFAKPVAIKRIHPDCAAEIDHGRALRAEAKIASRIRHPNVVAVLDVVEHDEQSGIVLEYVHGESLSSLLREASTRGLAIPLGVGVAIIVDALRGLHAAHIAVDDQGNHLNVVHRDVSPQNMIVGADGVTRVLDFGISKAVSRTTTTRDGGLKGKLRYMSPEQVGGDVSAASDVYAAGLVLWETLVGRSPFEDADNPGRLIALVLGGVSEAPSSLRQGVPASVDIVVARALAPLPSGRFPSAAAMADALEASGLAATRPEVALLVEEVAGKTLAARALVVSQLERGMTVPDAGSVRATEGKQSDEPLARSVETRRAPRGKLSVLAIVAIVAIGLFSITASFAARSAMREREIASASSMSAAGGPAPASAATRDSPSQDAAFVLPPIVRSEASARLPPSASTVVVAPVRPAGGKLRSLASASAGAAAAPDCLVPYTLDENGDRHYRRECFQ